MKRIMIAGTNSGCGKTTIACGLMAALSDTYIVQPYKVGPDYIDPAYHTFITGRNSSNLDSWILQENEVVNIFVKNSGSAGISVIEGVMGLHDGYGIEKDNGSSAHIAKITATPVILVIDGKAMALSSAALVKGFAEFDHDVKLRGVIVNNITSEKHFRLIKDSIERHTNIEVLGYLPNNKDFKISSRHLGLIPSCEIENLSNKISILKEEIKKYIDIKRIVEIAYQEWEFQKEYFAEEKITDKNVKIAVAYDKAFNFYYKDSLSLLEEYGAELVKFSPVMDAELPENIDAIYFGGGFPEIFSKELESNFSMKKSVIEKLSTGIPYLAECGGLMYLCDRLINFDGTINSMTGWFDFNCLMTNRLQRFGYQEIKLKENSILGNKNSKIRTHEFHRSVVSKTDIDTLFSIKKETHHESSEWDCGYRKKNGVAGYPHFHFRSNKNFAKSFVKAAEKYREKRCNI